MTGVAGFIGSTLTQKLLANNYLVVGIDNLNDYYDPQLKKDRLGQFEDHPNFKFYFGSIEDKEIMENMFENEDIDIVVNLAAQAGVRYSLENPYAYIDSNIVGFINVLECCRHHKIEHLVYASSSSVYGLNQKMPFSEHDSVNHPISLYAATKKSNEMMAHVYSHLFGLPTTGLRFFTVYGPWGRPDMALFLFTKAIIEDEPINVFNNGNMLRDFTYVDDIVEGIFRLIPKAPKSSVEWNAEYPDQATSTAPFKIFNIGNSSPVQLMEYINAIENSIGKKAKKLMLPMQDGDVPETYADTSELYDYINFKPSIKVQDGVDNFIKWYFEYYQINL